MKIRLQRGGFGESMETMEHVQPSVGAVRDYLIRHGHTHGVLSVTNTGYRDERNGWQTYIVSLNGCAVAFTDGVFCGEDRYTLTDAGRAALGKGK